MNGIPPNIGVRAIRLGGVDVTDAGIEFRAGVDLKDLEIELTNRLSSVAGVVANSRGDPVKDYSAIVFAQDSSRWKSPSRYVEIAHADNDGRFKILGLPPGDYYAVAMEHIEGDWNTAENFDALHTQATMFSLSESETKTLDLKLLSPRR